MTFVDPPPPAIGEVVFSWTNNGPNGPQPSPLGARLITVSLLAGAGFVLGLIGFFVVGGILQHQHHRIEAAWFLYSLAGGALFGAIIGVFFVTRPAKVSTLYVGKNGFADFAGGQLRLVEFRDVEGIRAHISVMTFRGVRTTAREIYVKRDGKERLHLVSAGEKQGDDPNYDYCDAVLKAFAER